MTEGCDITEAKLRDAVSAGIREAVSDPELWSQMLRAVQQHAQQEAGGWLFGGLKAALSKLAWFVVIGLGIYLMGGWTGLAAFLKSWSH